MFDVQRVEIEWAGRPLVLETGRIARQADGAVLATYGETTVLATVVGAPEERPGIDFFPLTVNYQEKTFAAGKIPGGFFKREGRPSEKETLTSRLIDRPIRPLFADGYKCETQVVTTVLSHDLENDPDIVAMVAASAALTLSGLPFMGPIGGARVGMVEGAFVLNPLIDQMEESKLDLIVAGTVDAVLMVESEAQELSEDDMLGAVMFGHKGFQPVIDAIIQLAEKAAKEPRAIKTADNSALYGKARDIAENELRVAYAIPGKTERHAAIDAVKAKVIAAPDPGRRRGRAVDAARRPDVQEAREGDRPRRHPRSRHPHRRPRRQDGPSDRRRGRPPAAHPRFGAVHPRRDPGAGGCDARHRRRRAVHRRPGGDLQGNLHAALQFPALFGG